MADIVIDETGITVVTQSEMLESAKTAFRTAFGDDTTVDDSISPDGQIARILSEMKSDIIQTIQGVASGMLPAKMTGVFLDEGVKLNGIERNSKAYSTAVLTCVAKDVGCTIDAGALAMSSGGVQFATDATLTLAGGVTGTVGATAVEAGPLTALAGSITSFQTAVYGLESVTNVAAAEPGVLDETDPALRARRWQTAVGVGLHHPSKIKSVLLNLADVTAVNVIETPGYVRAIVRGGASADIAAVLFGSYDFGVSTLRGAGSVAAGIETIGDVTVHCTDEDTGQEKDINFDRPQDVPIYIVVQTKKLAGKYPANGDAQIKDFIVQFFDGDLEIEGGLVERPDLGDDGIYATDMAAAARAVPGHKISAVYVGTAADPTDAVVSLDVNQYPITAVEYIEVVGV